MRVYLDNCCFNRPFDDQSQDRIRRETEAVLRIQTLIVGGTIGLIWSYMMDFENDVNPIERRRSAIGLWKSRAVDDLSESPAIVAQAVALCSVGLRTKDSLHLAIAMAARSDYFVTTDDILLRKAQAISTMNVVTPQQLLERIGS